MYVGIPENSRFSIMHNSSSLILGSQFHIQLGFDLIYEIDLQIFDLLVSIDASTTSIIFSTNK